VLLAHDALDVLEHDDRVVHDDADRQHHAEQRERVDRVTQQQQPAKVPISDTGTAANGISVARQFCRNRNTTTNTSAIASARVFTTSRIETFTKRVVS
jgi:hypothetical protein